MPQGPCPSPSPHGARRPAAAVRRRWPGLVSGLRSSPAYLRGRHGQGRQERGGHGQGRRRCGRLRLR
jgi:hypothetical protein